jgi:hypothetical protein
MRSRPSGRCRSGKGILMQKEVLDEIKRLGDKSGEAH